MRYPKFKAYFYNGFGKPELVATSITGLLTDIQIADNFLGDVTREFREECREFKKHKSVSDLKEDLCFYDVLINPTKEDLQKLNKSFGLEEDTYLEEWIK